MKKEEEGKKESMRQKGKKDMEEDGIQEGMKIDMTTIGKERGKVWREKRYGERGKVWRGKVWRVKEENRGKKRRKREGRKGKRKRKGRKKSRKRKKRKSEEKKKGIKDGEKR